MEVFSMQEVKKSLKENNTGFLMGRSEKVSILIENLLKAPHMPIHDIVSARKLENQMSMMTPRVPFFGSIRDTAIEHLLGKTPVRVYTPQGKGPYPAVVYMHGGGFCFGSLETTENICRVISQAADSVIISLDYKLSPENKFPHALEECFQVFCSIRKNAKGLNVNPDMLAVAGDSAGGNLAAVLCLMMRDRKETAPVSQVLICPSVDMDTDPVIKAKLLRAEILLTADLCRQATSYYLKDPSETKNPLVSPLFAENLSGLPSAVIITADLDPLEKEALTYAALLQKAGNTVLLKQYKGLMHDFPLFTGIIDEGREAAEFIGATLRKIFMKEAVESPRFPGALENPLQNR
jgi:acetyl esterase